MGRISRRQTMAYSLWPLVSIIHTTLTTAVMTRMARV